MSGLRILVAGSRAWTDRRVIHKALIQAIGTYSPHLIHDDSEPTGPRVDWEQITLVHGGARGADRIAAGIGRALWFQIEAHPAEWRRLGRGAGPIRNTTMVQLGADVVLAFPIGRSPGTRDLIAKATAAGIPVVVTEGVAR